MKRDEIKQLDGLVAQFPGAMYEIVDNSRRIKVRVERQGRSTTIVKARVHSDAHGFRNFLGDVRRFCKGA